MAADTQHDPIAKASLDMKLFIKLIRNLLGLIIATADVLTRGTKLKRAPETQQQINTEVQDLTLYQFFACPFCIKTRRAMYKLNLPIEKRSASEGSLIVKHYYRVAVKSKCRACVLSKMVKWNGCMSLRRSFVISKTALLNAF